MTILLMRLMLLSDVLQNFSCSLRWALPGNRGRSGGPAAANPVTKKNGLSVVSLLKHLLLPLEIYFYLLQCLIALQVLRSSVQDPLDFLYYKN